MRDGGALADRSKGKGRVEGAVRIHRAYMFCCVITLNSSKPYGKLPGLFFERGF